MDFGSSHIFTQANSDTEELTPADFDSGIYQPIGSSLLDRGPGGEAFSQHDVLYDNVVKTKDGIRTQGNDEPMYDNRNLESSAKAEVKVSPEGGAYADPYDYLKRQSHPYEYAGPGSFVGSQPPPLPPMRKQEARQDAMMNEDPQYEGLGGEYMTLLSKGSSKMRRADTNIVAIKFDKLVQSEDAETGSPVFCGCCGAAMSDLSKISQLYSGKCWVCEFCQHENPVSDDITTPPTEDCTYVMGQGSGGGADTVVIFCVDVSGSMAVTTEVSGNIERPLNDEQVALQAYQEEWDGAEQRRRQAQEEDSHAHLMAAMQGTIDQQAQALAQFQLSRTESTASAVAPPSTTPLTPSSTTPSAPPAAPPLPQRASMIGQAVPPPTTQNQSAQGQGTQRVTDIEERYVTAPRREPAPPEPRKLVSYVSRLQSMQSAIQQQVTKLESESSQTRVGLVAFNNNVTVIGDGTLDPVPLEGAGLTDKDSLISLGQNFPLPGPIAEVRQCLSEKIFSLTESGQTALGPALLIAISMAAQKPGSKVIMCTDGMANVGLGALHNMDNDTAYEQAAAFYEEVANFARDSGVCVSVLTLEGEDCRAIELGQVADKTSGQVNIVKPDDLNQQFADILADRILATNVSAKMVLHKGLFLRDSENEDGESQATHPVGIVTADSETTFEFGVRRKEVLYDNYGGTTVAVREEEEPIYESVNQTMIEGLERLPFQVQIRYTGRDGLDYLRILTMDRPVTKDRKFAEQNANVGVIGAHAAQSAAKLAVEGHYAQARINAVITQKLVQRCTSPEDGGEQEGIYQTFLAHMAPIQSEITRAQQLEAERGEHLPSEGGSESEDIQLTTKTNKISKKMKHRRKHVSDRQASVFYRMKGATTKMFNKQTYNMGEVV